MITGRAAWNSEAPRASRDRRDPLLRALGNGPTTPRERHVLLEGTEPAALADCASPEIAILTANRGARLALPDAVIGAKRDWASGSCSAPARAPTQTLDLPAGRWLLSIQYFSPFDLTLTRPASQRCRPPSTASARTRSASPTTASWPAGEMTAPAARSSSPRAAERAGSRAWPATTARPRRRAGRGPRRAAPDRAAQRACGPGSTGTNRERRPKAGRRERKRAQRSACD